MIPVAKLENKLPIIIAQRETFRCRPARLYRIRGPLRTLRRSSVTAL